MKTNPHFAFCASFKTTSFDDLINAHLMAFGKVERLFEARFSSCSSLRRPISWGSDSSWLFSRSRTRNFDSLPIFEGSFWKEENKFLPFFSICHPLSRKLILVWRETNLRFNICSLYFGKLVIFGVCMYFNIFVKANKRTRTKANICETKNRPVGFPSSNINTPEPQKASNVIFWLWQFR